jgi:signal transduction histidine kinase
MAQTRLVDDLLDLSRIVTGKVRLSTEPLYIASAVQAAVESIKPAAEAKNIQIQTTLDPKAGPIIADEDRIQQIVWNLLSNAVKFTPPEGRIEICAWQDEDVARIQVIDSGVGIPPNFLPYIFDRFRQGDETSAKMRSGLGLGLAIVRHLIELHHGSIEASSAGVGQGAVFTLTFPLQARKAAAATN